MKKVGNLTIGGLQQKIFNLVLTTIIILIAAYTIVIAAQIFELREIGEKLRQSEGYSAMEDAFAESEQILLERAESSRTVIILLLVFITVACGANALVLAKKIISPLGSMSRSLTELSGENILFEMKDEYRTGDEIELLAETIAGLSLKTVDYINEIERITAEREKLQAEMNIAMQIQADMLPRVFPPFPERKEFDLYASINPDDMVGGDFYDFFFRNSNELVMLMADVSGRGIPAALFMVIAKTLLKNRAMQGGTPAEILEDVNRQLCDNNKSGMFVTVWLAVLDVKSGKGMAANAGHEHPMLAHEGEGFGLVQYKHSPSLAMDVDFVFEEHPFELKHGDTLFIYTDGATDLQDAEGEMFGHERLLGVLNRDAAATPKQQLREVTEVLEKFVADGGRKDDDITLMCLHFN
ncbi:MAG: serine/threonine-protein phosphatase [Lachnospiraceae bacterium]|nr:serine/threonine-protein phosphatase [Lachnospiraceae bacterium]